MATNYYYFVTGLPDLLLDEGKQSTTCVDFAEEAQLNLIADDWLRFNLFQLPFDNANLVGLLDKKEHGFDRRGSIDETALSAGLKIPFELPEYMQHFLGAYREGRSPHPGLSAADQLAWYFYEAMTNHENEFIREWYTFDLHLRNILAAVACRRNLQHIDALATDRDPAASMIVIGRDEVAEAILRSSAPDFGLSARLPWVERLLGLLKSKLIDSLRWDMLNDMTVATYFRAETVYAFYIKLTIVERWRALDPVIGKERLDRLLEELGKSYEAAK
jgi:hypothetical protein